MNIDFCIWPHLERVEALKQVTTEFTTTQEEYPRMNKWIQLITAVPAVKKTMFSPEMHIKLLDNMKARIFDFDLGL